MLINNVCLQVIWYIQSTYSWLLYNLVVRIGFNYNEFVKCICWLYTCTLTNNNKGEFVQYTKQK